MPPAARDPAALEVELSGVQRELRETQELLFQANRLAAVGEVTAAVVHELNQPLHVLAGYVELLRDGTIKAGPGDKAWDAMGRAVERATSLVKNLRTYAREQAGVVEPVDLVQVARLGVELVAGAAQRVTITGDPVVIEGIVIRLEQVVVNLVANALQAAPGDVTVRVSADEDHGILEVVDHGPGVPEEIRNKIFEPFFTTKPPGRGTGLGLAVVARIARDHLGSVEVRATEGGGATFVVKLPKRG